MKKLYNSRSRKKNVASYIDFVLEEGIATQDFLDALDLMSIEDILILKIELMSRLFKGKLYGFKLFHAIRAALTAASVKAAAILAPNSAEASSLLGISLVRYTAYLTHMKDKDIMTHDEAEKLRWKVKFDEEKRKAFIRERKRKYRELKEREAMERSEDII